MPKVQVCGCGLRFCAYQTVAAHGLEPSHVCTVALALGASEGVITERFATAMPCAVRLPGAKAAKALRAYLAGDDKDGASAWTPAALHEHAADANVPLNSTQAAHIEWSLRALQTELCPDEALDKADADARLLHRVARLVSHRFHRQHFHPQFISRAGPHKSLLANRIVQHPPAVALRSKTAIASAARCRAADALYCADHPLSALELEQLASSRAGTSSA